MAFIQIIKNKTLHFFYWFLTTISEKNLDGFSLNYSSLLFFNKIIMK